MSKTVVVIAAVSLLVTSGAALAQSKEKAPTTPRSAASLECSKQADEKGLKGKVRKKFRSNCLKEMKRKAA